MSDEEDYMSDAFLQKLDDTRPGLVPKNIARLNNLQKKDKLAKQQNKQKPKAVIEKETRDAGLGAALSSENKGFSLLQKMGYKPGMAIGKTGQGRTEPVPVEVKLGRGGLGREADQKRKKEHREQMHRYYNAKRQKAEIEHKQKFMRRMNEKFANKNVEQDLYKSQKVCEQLDSQLGIMKPHEAFFWPEALLPKDEEDTIEPESRLEELDAGYSGYVQDPGVDHGHQEGEETLDEEDGDDDMGSTADFTTEERLDVLTLYLRTKHKYCIWCGTKYEDKEDLQSNCPGNSAELHDDL